MFYERLAWIGSVARRGAPLLLAALVAGLWATPADAAVPGTFKVQGALQATGGGAVADGKYNLTFRLYNVPTGGTAVWPEGPVSLTVANGSFRHVLGVAKPVAAALLGNLSNPWLGVTVSGEPELPRQRVQSTLWAHKAGVAEGLACSGCVSVAALKIDGDLDLGGNALKAKTVASDQVSAGTVAATTFVGDGSKLTGIAMPAGNCPKGKVVSGIDKDGKLSCLTSGSGLPPDGLDEISGGVVHNQFVDVVKSTKVPLAIDDNNPVGTTDTIDVPDFGVAQKLTVTVDLSNSDLSKLKVILYDAANAEHVLYDKAGSGKVLVATYPDPVKPTSGDLTAWHGKNPKGKWRLMVIDSGFLNNGKDGAIKAWSVNIQTLSNKKIHVKGEMLVKGNATVGGLLSVGTSNVACTKDIAGAIRRNGATPQWCDGSSWRGFGGRGATYRWQVWSDYARWNGSWYADNNATVFGGINPSNWSNNYKAYQMSSTSAVLREFFARRGPEIGTVDNANVYSQQWRTYSDSNVSRQVGALFRVRNSTSKAITWKVSWYRTAYGGWNDRASIAVNGQNSWESGGSNYGAHDKSTHSLGIPANRTSTVIFVASSSSPCCNEHSTQSRTLFMAFYNDSLKLPAGLEFVDDIDVKPNGWDK